MLDNLEDMIDRSPVAPLAGPRARRNLAVELDKDERYYVCSKRPNLRGPSDSFSGTSRTSPVPNGTSHPRALLVGELASSLLPSLSPAGWESTDHHGRRQQLEPAVTHQRQPEQPRGITESCIELEIEAAMPKIVISKLTP